MEKSFTCINSLWQPLQSEQLKKNPHFCLHVIWPIYKILLLLTLELSLTSQTSPLCSEYELVAQFEFTDKIGAQV